MTTAAALPPMTADERAEFEARGWTFTENKDHWSAENKRLDREIMAETIEAAAERILKVEYEIEQSQGALILDADKFDAEMADGAIQAIAGDATLDDMFDFAPDDPGGRRWCDLPDAELSKQALSLRAALNLGDLTKRELLQHCEAEMMLRDRIEEIAPQIKTMSYGALADAQKLYAGEPRLLEIVQVEIDRRYPLVTVHVADDAKPESKVALTKMAQTAVEQMSLFDYAQLDESTAIICRGAAAEIREHTQSIKNSTELIGRRLREVKASLKRGQFDAWLKAETIYSRDTADRLIDIADWAERSPQFAANQNQFQRSAVYLLVAGGTPDSARTEAAARAEAGEEITTEKARGIVKAHKPAVSKPANKTSVKEQPAAQPVEKPAEPSRASAIEPVSEPVKNIPSAIPTYAKGICRICGCTDITPCIDGQDIPCCWVDQEETLCSACPELMQEHGLDEAALRERLRNNTRDDAPSPAVGAADAGAMPEAALVTPTDNDASRAEIAAWNQSLIKINIQLFKHDGDPAGRRVMIGVSADEDAPQFIFGRESEVFDFPPPDPLAPRAAIRLYGLPSPIAEPLLKLATGLTPKPAATAKAAPAKPAKKVTGKKAAPTKSKPAAKPTAKAAKK